MESATKSRDELDDQAVADELAQANGDDGMSRPEYGDGLQDDPTPDDKTTDRVPPTPPADLPDDGAPQDEDIDALVLSGDHQLSLTIGGKKPTSSVLKLKGGKLELDGEFRKGDRLRVTLDLRVGAVKIEDTVDSGSGEVKSTKRTQWATIEGAQKIESEG